MHALMVQLRKLKNAARIWKLTHLEAIYPNKARCTSKFDMLRRYCHIECEVQEIEELEEYLPNANTLQEISGCVAHFKRFQSVTAHLQEKCLLLHKVRFCISNICGDYPTMEGYLGLAPTSCMMQNSRAHCASC